MAEKKSPKNGNSSPKIVLLPADYDTKHYQTKQPVVTTSPASLDINKRAGSFPLTMNNRNPLVLDLAVSSSADDGNDSVSDGIPESFQECSKAMETMLRFMRESIVNRALVLDRLSPHFKMDFVYCLILQAQHYQISATVDDVADTKNTYLFAKIGKTANEDAGKIFQLLSESADSEVLISEYLKQSRVSSSKSRFYSITNGLSESRYVYTLKLCMFFPMDDFLGQSTTTETVTRQKLGCPLDNNWYRYINDGSQKGENRIGVNEWVVTTRNMIERFKKFKSLFDFHRFNVGMPSDFKGRDIKIEVHKSSGTKELLFQRRWQPSNSTTRANTPKSNRK